MNKGGKSYGEIPGNGHPKADDKIMNAGVGHVVPFENVPLAKKMVASLGYDPNVKVNMNQGGGSGANIRISSGEYFLNQDQVEDLKKNGIDPEILSPNSPYNQNVGPSSLRTPNMFADGGGTLYELMMNNNNQYSGSASNAYQDGGGVDYSSINQDQFNNAMAQKLYGTDYSSVQPGVMDAILQKEWPNFQAGKSTYQFLANEINPDLANTQAPENGTQAPAESEYVRPDLSKYPYSMRNEDGIKYFDDKGNMAFYEGPNGEILDYTTMTPEDYAQQGASPEIDVNNLPDNVSVTPRMATKKPEPILFNGMSNELVRNDVPAQQANLVDNTQAPSNETSDKPAGKSPEEQYLEDLTNKNKQLADKEVLANSGMFGYNLGRGRQSMDKPNMVQVREMTRDYQGMKNQATSDMERAERRNAYMLRNLGAVDKLPGVYANTSQGVGQISQSLWDMQQQDSMANINASNQAKANYENAMNQWRANEANAANQFQMMKGKAMSDNVAQIFDVRERELQNEASLKGFDKNNQMDDLDRTYNSLNKSAFGGKYFSRQDWYKMTPEQRQKYQTASDNYGKKPTQNTSTPPKTEEGKS